MTQTAEMVILECRLEELRCSVCNDYLSCAPIQVLPDGNSICGHCPTSAEQAHRNLRLEAVLNKALFPCRYKKYGCEERLLFGHTDEHEIKCDHRSFACPLFLDGTCEWEGSALQILDHCTEEHPDFIMENGEFEVQLDQDAEGQLIVVEDYAPFLIKFHYNSGTSKLHYHVNHFIRNLQEVVCKVQLINGVNQDYCTTLQVGSFLPYSANIDYVAGYKVLILNNFLPYLNNPNSVKVAVDLILIKSYNKIAVDYDLLQTLRCTACQGYLTPPLYNCTLGIVCSKCHEKFQDSKPSDNAELNERVAKANFPCYWIGCNFITESFNFQKHVTICPFRTFECIKSNECKMTFKQEEAIAHLDAHGYEYFSEVFVYKMMFKRNAPLKSIFTFKNNGIISIQYGTDTDKLRHHMYLNVSGTDITKLVVKVEFTHDHCKLKSKIYNLECASSEWHFWMKHLPACFKEDEELTATLKVDNN